MSQYADGEITMAGEGDLRASLYSECLRLMRAQAFERPYKIFAEVRDNRLYAEARIYHPDLVIGEREVLVEVKFTAATGTFTKKVSDDLKKLEAYIRHGIPYAYLVMIDWQTPKFRDLLKEKGLQPEIKRFDKKEHHYDPTYEYQNAEGRFGSNCYDAILVRRCANNKL